MAPPASSALDLYLQPKAFPTFTPTMDRVNVTAPIKDTAGTMSTFRNAKVTPTARASMLVATARRTMPRTSRDALAQDSSFSKDSFTMPAPMRTRRRKATQWS